MPLAKHDTPVDKAVIELIGKPLYDEMLGAVKALDAKPTRSNLAKFAALVAKIPADRKPAVMAAVRLAVSLREA